jgi:hypothetical protein
MVGTTVGEGTQSERGTLLMEPGDVQEYEGAPIEAFNIAPKTAVELNELDKLAEKLSVRHKELSKYPSHGGNPTTALSGALIAIKEVVEAIHAVRRLVLAALFIGFFVSGCADIMGGIGGVPKDSSPERRIHYKQSVWGRRATPDEFKL